MSSHLRPHFRAHCAAARRPRLAVLLAGSCALALSACGDTMDLDMRGPIGGLDTAGAARTATANRPQPDARGIISYPGYQVAVARRGDTLSSLAQRIGTDATALASYNGIQPGDPLRAGEVIALPGRVAEPAGGPIRPGDGDITQIAGAAIENASSSQIETSSLSPAATTAQSGVEPVRHKVARGETAYTIARLYNVSIRSLAEWNGLGSDFAVREGQFLIIPVALPGERTAAFDASDVPATTQPPGAGTPTPEPPSAATPLPEEDTVPAATAAATTPKEAPDLGQQQTTASAPKARMSYPVVGDIVRPYSKGKNDGIDIAASPGTAVKAADGGTVAAITKDTKGTPIIVVKHANNLLTVYSNVDNVAVKTGDSVSRGQTLAKIPSTGAAAVHFEVRNGFDSLDPIPYLTE
ncbi:LysM peptidoglycan-binding domain-containing protein [Roseovarius nanhaiticus]|uniref:LysM peptidoglycan-binding domain-containing protein n=1 Tax=Roseovarius nanhaiticus TaxID=573024 RepID=UPI0024934CF6|nr:LysM peptidoglycan-binding domain-containing protein [Roseovarius nanhaiticus]